MERLIIAFIVIIVLILLFMAAYVIEHERTTAIHYVNPREKCEQEQCVKCADHLKVNHGEYPSVLVLTAIERSSGEVVINYENGLVERQSYLLDAGQTAGLTLLKPLFTPQISTIDINGGCVVAHLQL